MKRGRNLFYLLLVVGTVACAVMWRIPGNKYDWMRTDPVVGTPSARLPVDQDFWVPLAFFAAPVLAIAVVNAVCALLWMRGVIRMLAVAFSLILLGVVLLKVTSG